MIIFMCLALPAVFFMFIREKILGSKVNCSFYGKPFDFIKEYLLSTLFLNFTAITITCHVFKHRGELYGAFNNTKFTFQYLILTIVLALFLSVLEKIIRFHLHIKDFNFKLPIIKFKTNRLLYTYALILFSLNFIRIFDNAFWGDEVFSISLAKMSFTEMIEATAKDVHPPLYYILLQFLYRIFGNEGFAYHLSSLVPYAAILFIACTFIKRKFGYTTAVVLITLSSLTKSAIQYNVEVRMYALAALFVLIAYLALYEILKNNNFLSWFVFIIASLGAAFTHYYALVSVSTFYLALLLLAYFKREYLKCTCIAYIITTLAYLPWLFVLIRSFERTANNWWLKYIPSMTESVKYLFDYGWLSVIFILVVLLFSFYQLKIFNLQYDENKNFLERFNFYITFPKKLSLTDELIWVYTGLFSMFGTIIVGLGLSYFIRPFFVLRYLFPVSAVAYLIMGFCLSHLKTYRFWCSILLVIVLSFNLPIYLKTYKNEVAVDRSTTIFLKNVHPKEKIYIFSNNYLMSLRLIAYYYPKNKEGYQTDVSKIIDTMHSEIWLFWSKELEKDEIKVINAKNYSLDKIYAGRFADGVNYHVYMLQKEVINK